MFAGKTDGRFHILNMTRNNHANRNLAIIGPVRRIQRPCSFVEPHFTVDRLLQQSGQGLNRILRNRGPRIVDLQALKSGGFILLTENG